MKLANKLKLTDYQHTGLLTSSILLSLALLTELFYWPSRNYPFEFDDIPNILKFYKIRSASFSDLFFSGPRWISYWLNTILYKLAGFEPLLYRQLNLIFHISTGLLVFSLVYQLANLLNTATTGSANSRPTKTKLSALTSLFIQHKLIVSTLTSALFLLHPTQSQTVTYVIQGQLEGLATLFVLVIANLFVLINNPNRNSKNGAGTAGSTWLTYFYTLLLFVTALLATGAKEILIVTPALIFLIDWFFVAQGQWAKLKSRALFYVILTSLILGAYLYFLKPNFFKNILLLNTAHVNTIGNIITPASHSVITPWLYLISEFRVILHYLLIFIWPFNLSFDYDWKLVSGFSDPACWLPGLILLALIGYIFYRLRKNRTDLISFGLLWFLLAVLPRSSLIPSPELINDYKTYLAALGIYLIFALALTKLLTWLAAKTTKLAPNLIYSSLILLFTLLLGFLTYQRNLVSATAVSYWADIVAKAPRKARAHNNYGIALTKAHNYPAAISEFKQAIKIEGRPATIAQFYWDPYNNLANLYALTDRVREAVQILEHGLKFNPNVPEPYNNLGMFYINLHEFDKAELNLRRSLELKPYHGKALFNLSKVYLLRKQFDQGLKILNQACLNSDLDTEPQAHIGALELYANIAVHLRQTKQLPQILTILLRYKPHDEQVLFNLAGAYVSQKDYAKARTIYQQLLQRNPQNQRYLHNLRELDRLIKGR